MDTGNDHFIDTTDSLFCVCVSKVDLDLGNYERFLDIKLTRDNNITTGKIYQASGLTWAFHAFYRLWKSLTQLMFCLSLLLTKREEEIIWEKLSRFLSTTELVLW